MKNTSIVATDKKHLKMLITQHIHQYGNTCNLNHIDTSKIVSMDELFEGVDFQGDISQWDTSNVQSMRQMFRESSFNGDISKWNVQKVQSTQNMFSKSQFKGALSEWKLSSLVFANEMFSYTEIKQPLIWELPRLSNASQMFECARIEGPLQLKIGPHDHLTCIQMFKNATLKYFPMLVMSKNMHIFQNSIFEGSNIPMHEKLLHSPLLLSKDYQPNYAYYIEIFSKMFNKTHYECETQIKKQLQNTKALRIEHFVWNILNPGMYEGPLWTSELNDFVQGQVIVMQALDQDVIWNAPDIYMQWLQRIQQSEIPLDLP